MNPIKNIHFTLIIRINNRLHEFNFRKRSDDSYDTDTSDDRSNRFYFKMIKNENVWVISGAGLPKWTLENEGAISDALLKADENNG